MPDYLDRIERRRRRRTLRKLAKGCDSTIQPRPFSLCVVMTAQGRIICQRTTHRSTLLEA